MIKPKNYSKVSYKTSCKMYAVKMRKSSMLAKGKVYE